MIVTVGSPAMSMSNYVDEVRHAVTSLLPVIWDEYNVLQDLQSRLEGLTRQMEDEYGRAAWLALNAEDAEDVALAAGMHWDAYWGADKQHHDQGTLLPELQAAVDTHRFSAEALAGALIQQGKQGISIVHGGLASAPQGRQIGTSGCLRNVIWQARNQALHWEDRSFKAGVVGCFDALAAEVDPVFTEYTQRNMSFEVVKLLGWRSMRAFEVDLLSLA
ncbi:hypothetical protein ACN268_11010 [Micromonospora sp. WMMD735]|uniref:hypothetical protein n=1 Tax=Micromonospora sp. WMMD735 TaxID=3404130 RepID=UPI003B94AC06